MVSTRVSLRTGCEPDAIGIEEEAKEMLGWREAVGFVELDVRVVAAGSAEVGGLGNWETPRSEYGESSKIRMLFRQLPVVHDAFWRVGRWAVVLSLVSAKKRATTIGAGCKQPAGWGRFEFWLIQESDRRADGRVIVQIVEWMCGKLTRLGRSNSAHQLKQWSTRVHSFAYAKMGTGREPGSLVAMRGCKTCGYSLGVSYCIGQENAGRLRYRS